VGRGNSVHDAPRVHFVKQNEDASSGSRLGMKKMIDIHLDHVTRGAGTRARCTHRVGAGRVMFTYFEFQKRVRLPYV
jgi:hypothetical protein